MHDLKYLIRLKLRHGRSALIRLAYLAGTDLAKDETFFERLYQGYIGILLAAAFLALWGALFDGFIKALFSFTPETIEVLFLLFLFLPFILLLFSSFHFLRSSPLVLTSPDTAYLAASPLDTKIWVCCNAFLAASIRGIFAFVLGFLFGTGLQIVWEAAISPLLFALLCFLGIFCTILGSWIIGIARLSLPSSRKWFYRVLIVAVLCLITVADALFLFSGYFSVSFFVSLVTEPISIFVAFAFLAGGIIEMALLAFIASHLHISSVIDESVLYAALYPLRHLAYSDTDAYRKFTHQKRLALRGPLIFLPLGQGSGTLLSRALLSHLRQFEGIPLLMLWGGTIIPCGVVLALGSYNPLFLFVWLQTLLLFPQGTQVLTQVYKSDVQNRTFRVHLPYTNLELLLLDSLPALGCMLLFSCIATFTFLYPFGIEPLSGLLTCFLMSVVFLLCSGLDGAKLASSNRQFTYEVGILAFVVFVTALSLCNISALVVGGIALFALLLLALAKSQKGF